MDVRSQGVDSESVRLTPWKIASLTQAAANPPATLPSPREVQQDNEAVANGVSICAVTEYRKERKSWKKKRLAQLDS